MKSGSHVHVPAKQHVSIHCEHVASLALALTRCCAHVQPHGAASMAVDS